MKSNPTHNFILSLVFLLGTCGMAGCSALISAPTPTTIETNATITKKAPVPSATITSTPEPSSTPTLLPTISLPTEVITSENIDRLQQLDARELAGKPEEFFPRSMDFTPDGRIVVAVDNTLVYVWDGLIGQLIESFDHSVYLWNVAISPDGKMVISGDDEGGIKIWDIKTQEKIFTFTHYGTIWSLAFSPDSTTLASGTLHGSVKLWNLINGKETDYIADVPVNSLAFSPDGEMLAIGTYDEIILWDIATKKPIKTFVFDLRREEGLRGIQGVLFSPDEKMIAAADADNIALVWEISTGKKLSTIVGKGTFIAMSEGTLTFSPDSKIIAAGNDNGEVIFWDVIADKELRTIGSQMCIPWDLIFWSDGKAFEVACWNGTIQLWGLP